MNIPQKGDVVDIDIGSQFSRFPAGRTPDDGRYSGEAFRERFLKNNLAAGKRLVIYLDNAVSYGSSFLEEAFGGLVRTSSESFADARKRIDFKSSDPFLIDEIWTYIDDAVKVASRR